MPNIQKLIEIIESFRREHHYECEDGFYSCPAHPEYFGNDSSRQCNCGLWSDNEKVDEALQIVRGLTPRAVDGVCTHPNYKPDENIWCPDCGVRVNDNPATNA